MHEPIKYRYAGTFRIKDIKRTCSACPAQWEGKLSDGRVFYGRFRHSNFRLYVSKTPMNDWLSYDDMDLIYQESIGDGLDGWMTDNELYAKLLDYGNGILVTTVFERLYIRSAVILEPIIFKAQRIFWDLYYKTPMGKRYLKKESERIEKLFANMKPKASGDENVQN